MRLTERNDNARANSTGSRYRQASAGVRALSLLLIVVSIAGFIVACGSDPSPAPEAIATTAPEPTPEHVATTAPEPTPDPSPTTTPEPTPESAVQDDDVLTQAFVTRAIDYYTENGLDATVEFYKSEEGMEDGRTLILLDKDQSKLLVFRSIPALEGQNVGPGS